MSLLRLIWRHFFPRVYFDLTGDRAAHIQDWWGRRR
jgi:hypothetical protein